ncbi:hypothetical protein KQ302_11140 [Synechococcus sp. CS-602]|uniref:hypothetical protein n=1 Tax=Synechococcaceae TaxID=1890426 RepID=UPI0008FF1990|nr:MULTISPECIES: hypothetical protein [Synechococcaceae]MCT4363552.1 hypothetical protein [Candidatus Regnicoccus frigidus MAG-AL1]APD47194.1 hypothetical protein BM449_01260 [Synechococcus sp. SynAce01]MCT0201262.1 hypothetical protein [Synechococcus sp. CS-603]MCT0205646.1 hypothetical protein [Synechococcus sp. CS-602]MCT0245550.1 hypothetical protein [Synechococcus sp. CS-601]
MAFAIIFVLAAEADLPGENPDWDALLTAQHKGISGGVALRIFKVPKEETKTLDELVSEGLAVLAGADPLPGVADESGSDRICDATVPHLEPRSRWLAVYELSGAAAVAVSGHPALQMEIEACRCLDRFPLREAANETCWFYPTENGRYLCWENQRQLQSLPGFLPDQPVEAKPVSYDRQDVHVLWSLMADDQALTCVGLTYQGRQIEWSTTPTKSENWATWTSFEVDTMADEAYKEITTLTVF